MERQADWRQEKAQALARARVVVIKVGSAVLTDAQGLSTPVLESLARQMAALRTAPDGHERRLVLVSSGAVAAGRAVLRAHGHSGETSGLSARQAAAAVGQGQLMRAWDEVFRAYDFPTSQVLLTRDDLRARQRFLNARNTFAELMDWGVLPIVNENDTVSVSELKFGDNDCLASLLVNLIGADLYINLTSAPGVYAANPQEVPDAGILECVEDVAGLDLGRMCGGKTSVGTGGMYSKLQAARRAAQLGVPTLILPGREADVLARAFAGEAVGPSRGTRHPAAQVLAGLPVRSGGHGAGGCRCGRGPAQQGQQPAARRCASGAGQFPEGRAGACGPSGRKRRPRQPGRGPVQLQRGGPAQDHGPAAP